MEKTMVSDAEWLVKHKCRTANATASTIVKVIARRVFLIAEPRKKLRNSTTTFAAGQPRVHARRCDGLRGHSTASSLLVVRECDSFSEVVGDERCRGIEACNLLPPQTTVNPNSLELSTGLSQQIRRCALTDPASSALLFLPTIAQIGFS
jgi:hypothetical protein